MGTQPIAGRPPVRQKSHKDGDPMNQHEYEAENQEPLRIWGLISDDPDVQRMSQDLHFLIADRRARGIPTGGATTHTAKEPK